VNRSSPFNATIKRLQHIFVCDFVENQRIFVLFSTLDSLMIGTFSDINFTHRTQSSVATLPCKIRNANNVKLDQIYLSFI